MKIFRVINDYIHAHINKYTAEWDDVANIPDIADTFTADKYDINNPLSDEFWREQLSVNDNIPQINLNKICNIETLYNNF